MLCSLYNPTPARRIVYDINSREVRLEPGERREGVDLPITLLEDLEINAERNARDMHGRRLEVNGELPAGPVFVKETGRSAIEITGMNGIGDCIHQRAVVRELMRDHDVWLRTCHYEMYRDLVEQGLHLIFQPTHLHAQALTIERERGSFPHSERTPTTAHRIKLWYKKEGIDRYGSILQTMLGVCGVKSERPDFTIPVRPEWRARARALIASWNTGGRAIMVYRPIVIRDREWKSGNRNPEPQAYAELFAKARESYFVVSVAHLVKGLEEIVGPEQHADVKLHAGELDFPTMAALWAEANIGFFNAGFAPVLAQAVGLPSIVVYGGRESYRTTQAASAHLAPTLGIDPINPCDCHTESHRCDKRIDLPRALREVSEFAPRYLNGRADRPTYDTQIAPAPAPQVMSVTVPSGTPERMPKKPSSLLIFGTVYCDCADRQRLTEQWIELTRALNPDADLMLVDSASPFPLVSAGRQELLEQVEIEDLGDNIGHLSRGGRDGWGRAFCRGLSLAIERGYETVAHVEGDSLLARPVAPLADAMRAARRSVATTPVRGMKHDLAGWVETGLMVFDVPGLIRSNFVRRYDWPNRRVTPTPELIIGRLVQRDVHWLNLMAVRNDKGQYTHETVCDAGIDWITHCHTDVWAFDRFFEKGLRTAAQAPPPAACDKPAVAPTRIVPPDGPRITIADPGLKLNLGCGTNKLAGWTNHDADVDITKPLPWAENSADYIFIEHCVEHIAYYEAIGFFKEALRVLRPGGVLRVTVPSIEQIAACKNEDYFRFVAKWGGEATRHGAMHAILYAHGHATAWTASLMQATLDYVGFIAVEPRGVGQSNHAALKNVEGHASVIGEAFNTIESMPFEATKPGGVWTALALAVPRIGIVLGSGLGVEKELSDAREMLRAIDAEVTVFAINNWIEHFSEPCIAVSLHPLQRDKLPRWLEQRRVHGYPEPLAVWSHKAAPGVTNHTEDWAGSSGLFAVKVARSMGIGRVVLCGVPMEETGGHKFEAKKEWTQASSFRRAWVRHRADIAPIVRSMSGWTRQTFGMPDAKFLSA